MSADVVCSQHSYYHWAVYDTHLCLSVWEAPNGYVPDIPHIYAYLKGLYLENNDDMKVWPGYVNSRILPEDNVVQLALGDLHPMSVTKLGSYVPWLQDLVDLATAHPESASYWNMAHPDWFSEIRRMIEQHVPVDVQYRSHIQEVVQEADAGEALNSFEAEE